VHFEVGVGHQHKFRPRLLAGHDSQSPVDAGAVASVLLRLHDDQVIGHHRCQRVGGAVTLPVLHHHHRRGTLRQQRAHAPFQQRPGVVVHHDGGDR